MFIKPKHHNGLVDGPELTDKFVHQAQFLSVLVVIGGYIVSFVVKAPNGGVFAMSAKEGDTCVECNPVDPGGEF